MWRWGWLLIGLFGCAGQGTAPPKSAPAAAFNPAVLAKSTVDRFAEAHQREVFVSLRRLTEKLYKRNPREWKKSGQPSLEAALSRIYDTPHQWRLPELENRRDIEALSLAFRPDYTGDRVLALSVGLASMVQTAFNDKVAFFVTDELDPQRLFNAARNVEIAAWKMNNDRDVDGNLILLSNDMGPPRNLSFEREMGRIIGGLDVLSQVMAERSQRVIITAAQSMATAVFLPIK
ncbi:MAG: hypothetical protein RIR70_1798 [Pseudomonadota bacterium]|jgi:hypothetical protein